MTVERRNEATRFKKGQSGNPKGRPKKPADVRLTQHLTDVEFIRLTNSFLQMTKSELSECLKDPHATMMQLMVGGLCAKAPTSLPHAQYILDRIIGKVPNKIELDGSLDLNQLSTADIMAMASEAMSYLREAERF